MLEDDDLDTGAELPINALPGLTNERLTNKLRATKQTPQLACNRSSDCHFWLHFSFSGLQLDATFATADLPVPRHDAFHNTPTPDVYPLPPTHRRPSSMFIRPSRE